MSILIKGMEMPNNCAECPINHDAECAVKNCMVIDDCYVRRAFWCPLIELPPHGDLVDINALKIAVMNGECNTRFDFLKHTMDCINKAPIVIEGEKEE